MIIFEILCQYCNVNAKTSEANERSVLLPCWYGSIRLVTQKQDGNSHVDLPVVLFSSFHANNVCYKF